MGSKGSIARRETTRRYVGAVDSNSHTIYLKELSDNCPLTPAQEEQRACEIVEAREALAALVLQLPGSCRERVTEGSIEPRPGKRWPLEHLETCLKRLSRYESDPSDPELVHRFAEIESYKKRLDRARDALVLANLRFVPHVAKRFAGCGLPFMDLVQEGNLGLLKAVDRFEHERGFRFCTYAFWWIRQSITKAIGDKARLVRLPAQIGAGLTRLRTARRDLSDSLSRTPTLGELAEHMNLSRDQVDDLLAIVRDARPLDELATLRGGREGADAARDSATPLDQALDREVSREIDHALGRLSRREEEVLRLRFGLNRDRSHTLREIGAIFGISRERIRQIEQEALTKLSVHHLRALRGARSSTRSVAARLRRRTRRRRDESPRARAAELSRRVGPGGP